MSSNTLVEWQVIENKSKKIEADSEKKMHENCQMQYN